MTTTDTAENLRVKLAKRLGWVLNDLPNHPNGHKLLWMTPAGQQLQSGTPETLPSLPALVSEAEGRLTEEQRKLYGWAVEGLLMKTAEGLTTFRLITASPETRAAALLEIL